MIICSLSVPLLQFSVVRLIIILGYFSIWTFSDEDDNESSSTRDDDEADSASNVLTYCGELVSAVLEMKDNHGRVICQLFKKIPPESVSSILKENITSITTLK